MSLLLSCSVAAVGLAAPARTTPHAGRLPALSFPEFTAGFQGLMQRSVPANGALPHGAESMPGEAAQILAAGNFIRDNIVWSDVETTKGRYNFSRTDALLAEYDAAGGRRSMRWMATLAYSNPLYDSPGPPTSKEGVDAFVAFTVAAVRRYKGRGVLWELWCEPNGVFWDGGKGNVTQYVALASAVHHGVVVAGLDDEAFIGPNTAMWWQYDVDLPFLEACLRGGVLEYWSAINLHLYRASPPETVQDSYRKTRALIQRYLPKGMRMPPLISGEWGYSDQVWGQSADGWYPYTGQIDTMTQAKYLARMWLTNTLEGVPSIWCKFLSGTGKLTSSGDMLGVVHAPYATPAQPHAPKPAYLAARTLHTHLRGGVYRGRISANFAKPLPKSAMDAGVRPVDWRGKVLPDTRSAERDPGLDGHQYDVVGYQQRMMDPDGISVMGYADLPQATSGSPLYVLAFDVVASDSHTGATTATTRTYSVWSVAGPCSIVFPAREGCYEVIDLLGESRKGVSLCTNSTTLRVDNVTDAPLVVAYRPK